MILREKSKVWRLTFPFAHNNYTTIGNVLYYPKDHPPSPSVMAHEEIHSRQQEEVGLVRFILLYLLVFPILWNPWRKKWEMEAYVHGSGFKEPYVRGILKTYRYGWLL